MKVISLGAGVQSSTLFLKSCYGEIEKADYALFADTGWEPKAVYEHLEKLKAVGGQYGIPVITVTIGNLREDALNKAEVRFAPMPLFTKDENSNKVSQLRRQCTREYKVAPLQKKCKELGATAKDPAEVWIGISIDESHRMKDSFVKYTYHRWPLIEMRMDRGQCRLYLQERGWVVPKSSCIGCPFHDDHYWRRLKAESPEEFADAVEFDKAIRQMPRPRDKTYLHRSAVPLDEVVFSGDGQADLFGNECEGMCGV